MNPSAQGASLTEGKRARRSKNKQNGETDQPRSGSPKSDEDPPDISAPLPKHNVNILGFVYIFSFIL